MKRVYLDFEYNRTNQARQNLVACSLVFEGGAYEGFWLDKDDAEKARLKSILLTLRDDGCVFVAFNVVAEATSFISLGVDPTKCQWVDIQAEYKMLLNHNNKFAYGDQLIKGVKKTTRPPKSKWEQTEEDKKDDSNKPEKSLVACAYKLLGVDLNLAHKNEMRDLIISCPDVWKDEDKRAVLEYCISDAEILPKLLHKILEIYRDCPARHSGAYTSASILWRGESVARAAMIEKLGYPVNKVKVENFSRSVPGILSRIAEEINEQFPAEKIFVFQKNTGNFTLKQAPLRSHIETLPQKDRWQKTDGGQLSLALEAWERHFHFQHDYPAGNLPAQIIRFLKTKQNLNGFLPKPKNAGRERRSFFDYYGEDGRARCYLNPYGSQSSRFQPPATGFIPLKSAWMRSLIEPKEGMAIASIDYASEEFLLAALLSKDKAMYESYASGDPYLAFAKRARAVPADATKTSHPFERTRFKSTVLGVGYLMGDVSLADKLTVDTGVPHSSDEAAKLIALYFDAYPRYAAWIDATVHDYKKKGYLTLLDGWVMYGDNPNRRSISNCPVQGAGACVLRRAIKLAQERGLKIIIPLHDAIYIQYPVDKPESIDVLAACMMEAFGYYFQKDALTYVWSQAIRLDYDAWGPNLQDGEIVTPGGRRVKTQSIYIDPRGKNEYERFREFF